MCLRTDLVSLAYLGVSKENDKTLTEWGLKQGAKVMLVGSTLTEVFGIVPKEKIPQVEDKEEAETSKEASLSEHKVNVMMTPSCTN